MLDKKSSLIYSTLLLSFISGDSIKFSDNNRGTNRSEIEIMLENQDSIPPYKLFSPEPERDYDSGAITRTVSRHEMPHNVAGFYTSSNHDITHPNDRSYGSSFDIFVRAHESVHATYGTTNEFQTDSLAAAKTGHFEYIRNGINEHVRL